MGAILGSSSFNPCFSGCLSPVAIQSNGTDFYTGVSILVLVDVFLQCRTAYIDVYFNDVSILVLVDVFLQFP